MVRMGRGTGKRGGGSSDPETRLERDAIWRATTSRRRFELFREYLRRQRRGDDASFGGGGAPTAAEADAPPRKDRETRRRYLGRYYRWLRPFIPSLALATSVGLVMTLFDLFVPWAIGRMLDVVIGLSKGGEGWRDVLPMDEWSGVRWLWVLALGALVSILVSRLLGLWRSMAIARLSARATHRLRSQLYRRLVRLPLEDLQGMKSGGVVSRLSTDVDQTVGRVVAKVRDLGLEDDTIILFSSDNGPHQEGGHAVKMFDSAGPFQGYKRSLHEGGIRVPFIAWGPGRIPAGRVSDEPCYFPDLFNTVCELVRLPPCGPADGHSLLPLLEGREAEQPRHPHLYFEFDGQIAVRAGRWKFYRDADGNEALHDLETDLHEDADVKDQHPETFARLKGVIAIEHRAYQPTPVAGGAIP